MELLERLPESQENLSLRESVLKAVLEAYESAFETQRKPDGGRDLEYLKAAKRVADAYVAEYSAAYGADRPRNPEVDRAIEEIDGKIAEQAKEEEPPTKVPEDPEAGPCLSVQPCLSEIPPPQGCGDSQSAAPFALVPLAASARRRRRHEALTRLAAQLPADVVARLHARADDVDD